MQPWQLTFVKTQNSNFVNSRSEVEIKWNCWLKAQVCSVRKKSENKCGFLLWGGPSSNRTFDRWGELIFECQILDLILKLLWFHKKKKGKHLPTFTLVFLIFWPSHKVSQRIYDIYELEFTFWLEASATNLWVCNHIATDFLRFEDFWGDVGWETVLLQVF